MIGALPGVAIPVFIVIAELRFGRGFELGLSSLHVGFFLYALGCIPVTIMGFERIRSRVTSVHHG